MSASEAHFDAGRWLRACSEAQQLVHTLLQHDLVDRLHLLLYPLVLGSGKRLLPTGVHAGFKLKAATPFASGVVSLDYERAR